MGSGSDCPHFDTTVLRLGAASGWFRMKAFICGIGCPKMGLDSIRQWALFVCIIAVISTLAGCAMTARVDETSFTFTFTRFVDEKDL
jgi:hypothetical protein